MENTATFIKQITVIDPGTNSPVEIEIFKHNKSAGIFAIDSSFLANCDEVPFDPFNGKRLTGEAFGSVEDV